MEERNNDGEDLRGLQVNNSLMSFDNLEKNLEKQIIILLLLFKKIQLDEKCVF